MGRKVRKYNDGITNNNVSSGTLTWNVQFDAPRVLYYQCTSHGNMGGVIYIDNANTGSGDTTDISALNTFTGSAISNNQTSSMSVATASFATGFTIFNGNRVISNTSLPAGVYNTNAGTSGSLSQFVKNIFPNTVPSITTNGFTIGGCSKLVH